MHLLKKMRFKHLFLWPSIIYTKQSGRVRGEGVEKMSREKIIKKSKRIR